MARKRKTSAQSQSLDNKAGGSSINDPLAYVINRLSDEETVHIRFQSRCDTVSKLIDGELEWEGVITPDGDSKISGDIPSTILDNFISKTVPHLTVTCNITTKDPTKAQELTEFINDNFARSEEMQWVNYRMLYDFFSYGRGVLNTYYTKDDFFVQVYPTRDTILIVRGFEIIASWHVETVTASVYQELTGLSATEGKSYYVGYYIDNDVIIATNDSRTQVFKTEKNPFGYVPFLHAPYAPTNNVRNNYGQSILSRFEQLIKEHSYRLSDLSNNARLTVHDELVLKSDKMKKEDVVRGANQVHQIGTADEMKILQKNQVNPDIQLILKEVKAAIYGGLGLNAVVIGVDADGNVYNSGKALRYYFTAIEERIIVARATLTPLYKRLFDRILRWGAMFRGITLPEEYDIAVNYFPMFPEDQTVIIDDTIKLVDKRLMSRQTAMKKVGITDPEAEMKLIKEDEKNNPVENPNPKNNDNDNSTKT